MKKFGRGKMKDERAKMKEQRETMIYDLSLEAAGDSALRYASKDTG